MRNAMLINEKDNVIVAIEPLSKGTKAVYQVNGRPEEVKVLADIPMYHKIARVPLKAGSEIIKYGEYIGEAAVSYTHLDVYKRQTQYMLQRSITVYGLREYQIEHEDEEGSWYEDAEEYVSKQILVSNEDTECMLRLDWHCLLYTSRCV